MNYKKYVVLSLVLISSLYAKEFDLCGDALQQYRTLEEKKELFKIRNIEYSNKIVLRYSKIFQLDHKNSRFVSLTIPVVYDSGPYEQEIRRCHLAPIYIQWISVQKGYGAFAMQDIKAGNFVGIYTGALCRYQPSGNDIDDTAYAWLYPVQTQEDTILIDAHHTGNEILFVNFAPNPNTQAVYYLVDGIFVPCYIAKRDIAKDEEITVDYGTEYCTSHKLQ